MRELKFRAWDKLTKRYYAVSGLEYDDNGELCEIYLAGIQIDESDPCANVREPSDVVLEQDTGLRDQNGKEIYVGDIVKIARSYGYGFLPKGAKAKIEFDEKELCYKLRGQGEFRLTAKKELEVIGNIHENPELLEGK